LFLVSLDEERTWYRYHALFRELLRNQLLQAEPERMMICKNALQTGMRKTVSSSKQSSMPFKSLTAPRCPS
jgi:ATP/maltotriose-dependent transcriptional regulator MalT